MTKGHFTHETESPWPLHFKHSHWWERWSQSKFTPRLRDQRSMWMQDGCKSLHGFLHGIKWIMFHGHLDYFKNRFLEVGLTQIPKTMALWTLTTIILSCVRTSMNRISWNNIWLRARSHTSSRYTWESVITLHDFGSVLGRPLDTFFQALSDNVMVTALRSCVKWPKKHDGLCERERRRMVSLI